jgi:pimeloyl-ACP methyl ester carboxylesterase
MHKILVSFFVFTLLYTETGFTQADLTVTSSTLTEYTANVNQPVTVQVVVKNAGNIIAGTSTMFLYLSSTTTFTNIIGKVTVPTLQPAASYTVSYIYVSPQTTAPGNYYIGMEVDGNNVVVESNENNTFYAAQPLQITNITSLSQKIPYPVIFIHGLCSSDATWANTINVWMADWGLSNGGRLDFCLNSDQNINTANFASDYTDFTAVHNESNMQAADCYFVNFDVDYLGNYGPDEYVVQSNQSAVFKQGRAVRDAIKHVMHVTGRDKVIIVGHSMGGLATREYLQHSSIWQADNKHHIAKLYTLGTPHGGSNSTAGWFNAIAGIDGNSEACRDLRYPSTALSFPGKYLFGGIESLTNNGNVHNDDINCNGIIGDTITALNGVITEVPLDINYTCLIGTGALTGGDGIVDAARANLNNYGLISPPAGHVADTLIYGAYAFTETHTDLPGLAELNVQGIDEPNLYNLNNYSIDTTTWYMGLINVQSKMTNVSEDYDYVQFTNTNMQSIAISLSNNFHPDLSIKLINTSAASTVTINANGRSNIDTVINIGLNTYALEIAANPESESWQYPYYYKISPKAYITASSGINVIAEQNTLFKIFPNPATQNVINCNINSVEAETADMRIIDISGQVLIEKPVSLIQGNNSMEISVAGLSSGVYYCSVTFKNQTTAHQQLLIMNK